MIRPTRTQLKLLKAVHKHAVAVGQIQRQAKLQQLRTGQPPPSSWYEDFHGRGVLRHELANAARAAGIPAEWIAQCETRGELRQPWTNRLHWREPATVADRTQVLASLEREVRTFQDRVAVLAVHGERAARSEVGTAQMVDRRLRVMRQWLGGLAGTLDITADEADRLWGPSSWNAAADSVRAADTDSLDQRWRRFARTDLTSYGLQAKALMAAGFDVDAIGMPTLDAMTGVVAAHLSNTAGEVPGAVATGSRISRAIDAAGIGKATDHIPDVVPSLSGPMQSPSSVSEVEP